MAQMASSPYMSRCSAPNERAGPSRRPAGQYEKMKASLCEAPDESVFSSRLSNSWWCSLVSSSVRDSGSPILTPAVIETDQLGEIACSKESSPHPFKDVETPTPMLSLLQLSLTCAKDSVRHKRRAPSMQTSFITLFVFCAKLWRGTLTIGRL